MRLTMTCRCLPSTVKRGRNSSASVGYMAAVNPLGQTRVEASPFEKRRSRVLPLAESDVRLQPVKDLSLRELIKCPLYRCVPKEYKHKVIRRGR
jgi:hypothetical protein